MKRKHRKKQKKQFLRWRITKKNETLFRMLTFVIKLNLFAIPLYLIILSGFQWILLMEVTRDLTLGLLDATGIAATTRGSLIIVPVENGEFGGVIDWDCTGWKSMLALFALIFATSFPMRKKLIGLTLLPVIYLINIIRIWFMFYSVSVYDLTYYKILHATVWSWGLITAVLVLWLLWMKSPSKITLAKKYIVSKIK